MLCLEHLTKLTNPSHWHSGTRPWNTHSFWHEVKKRWLHFLWSKLACFRGQRCLTSESTDNHITVHTLHRLTFPHLRDSLKATGWWAYAQRWNVEDLSGSASAWSGSLFVFNMFPGFPANKYCCFKPLKQLLNVANSICTCWSLHQNH